MKFTKWLSAILALFSLSACSASKHVAQIHVKNPTALERENEMVEVDWTKIKKQLSLKDSEAFVLMDSEGELIPCQILSEQSETPSKLIFLATLSEKEKKTFYLTRSGATQEFEPMVYGRLVPERKDDFAWENNRVAYRIYGPALQATGEISNGLDIWVKSVEKMVIDKWYKDDIAGIASYHRDHGEGVDFYKVGPTLGLGMTAPVYDDKLCLGKNFISSEILDQGPLRITMKFKYAPYQVGDSEVTETRIISLDAYSYLNKVVKIFESNSNELTLATGLLTSGDGSEPTFGDQENGIIAYEVPADKDNGSIYTGAINPLGYKEVKSLDNHYSGINTFTSGKEYVYYTGGGWSKHGFTEGFEQWTDYLKNQRDKLKNPLKIKVK